MKEKFVSFNVNTMSSNWRYSIDVSEDVAHIEFDELIWSLDEEYLEVACERLVTMCMGRVSRTLRGFDTGWEHEDVAQQIRCVFWQYLEQLRELLDDEEDMQKFVWKKCYDEFKRDNTFGAILQLSQEGKARREILQNTLLECFYVDDINVDDSLVLKENIGSIKDYLTDDEFTFFRRYLEYNKKMCAEMYGLNYNQYTKKFYKIRNKLFKEVLCNKA